MTTVSSILSIGLLPLNLMLYTYLAYGVTGDADESIVESLDFGTLFITLGIVLLAIMSGLLAGYTWDNPRFHIMANRFGSICGLLLIVFSVFLSSGGEGSDSTFWNMEWSFYIAVAFPCLLGLALANLISNAVHLSHPETVAIAIECCYQNTGIATSVAITMFDDPEERAQAVAVPLFYGVVEAVAIGIYCSIAWKLGWTKAPANENLCVVLGKTYEVEESPEEPENPLAGDPSEFHTAHEETQDSNGNKVMDDYYDTDQELQQPQELSSSPPPQEGFWARCRARLFGPSRPETSESSSAAAAALGSSEQASQDKLSKKESNRN
jgi:hypothetical protein